MVNESHAASFSVGSFARFNRVNILGKLATSLAELVEINFRTRAPDGVLFFSGKRSGYVHTGPGAMMVHTLREIEPCCTNAVS